MPRVRLYLRGGEPLSESDLSAGAYDHPHMGAKGAFVRSLKLRSPKIISSYIPCGLFVSFFVASIEMIKSLYDQTLFFLSLVLFFFYFFKLYN